MPFGTVSAVYAWHRVGHALWYIVVVAVVGLLAPMGRYVDDFFGASKYGVSWTGGACLSVVAEQQSIWTGQRSWLLCVWSRSKLISWHLN